MTAVSTPERHRALLRRFEPIIHYTRGEHFFPMPVAQYVSLCSLWVQRPRHLPLRLVPTGELTLQKLAEPRDYGSDAVFYLKYIEPLELNELAAYRLREVQADAEKKFVAGRGRLARVGYGSRLVDAAFSLSLLARGRVPGDTAAAARLAYEKIMDEEETYQYYGRVVRQNGWIVLQYWFFYAYNEWRSGFHGANDHEADWEMLNVYLYETARGELKPEWVAFAAHDADGDNLRRRWDDPEVEKVGEHPVLYAGAGSHAGYFQRGEYLAEIELPFLAPVLRGVDRVQAVWENAIYGRTGGERWSRYSLFRIPFVEYARGDGEVIGPETAKEWSEPELLEPAPGWVRYYRGLWGLYTRDPFSGEDAPAGPMYNRDGTVRRAWYDPLGWAGLDKVPTPPERRRQIEAQLVEIGERQTAVSIDIHAKIDELQGLGVEHAAMRGKPHLQNVMNERARQIEVLSAEIDALRAQRTVDEALAESLLHYLSRLEDGFRDPIRAHIRRPQLPASDAGMRLNTFVETWAAISIALFMIGFFVVAIFAREYLLIGLASLLGVIVFVEATFRRRLASLITSLTIGLALIGALVLLYEFFWNIVIFLVLLAGGYILWQNVRELRRR